MNSTLRSALPLFLLIGCDSAVDPRSIERPDATSPVSANVPAPPAGADAIAPSPTPSTALLAPEEIMALTIKPTPLPASCEPCPINETCDNAWFPLPIVTGPEFAQAPQTCRNVAEPERDRVFYHECVIAEHLPAEQCGLPTDGGVVCAPGNTRQARWTRTCHHTSDCPAEMACVFDGTRVEAVDSTFQFDHGLCEKACDAASAPNVCIRCDMECDTEQRVCRPALPGGPPCQYDCDCERGLQCDRGTCRELDGEPSSARCGDPSDPDNCACVGGVCSNHCCILANGVRANRFFPECGTEQEQ